MKLYALLPCAVLAAAFSCSVSLAADAPGAPAPAGKPAGRMLNLTTVPISLLNTMATLTDDEKSKIQAIDDKLKADSDAARTSGSKDDARTKIKALNDQANTDIKAVLTADQLAAITMYEPAVELLASSVKGGAGAVTKLDLTSDQLNKLKAVADDLKAKQKALDDETKEKQADLTKAAKDQASDVLTPDQKAALETKPVAPKHPKNK